MLLSNMWNLQNSFPFSTQPENSKIEPRKIQKGPNSGQNEEHEIEKCLENEIFNLQEEELDNSFLNIHISQKNKT